MSAESKSNHHTLSLPLEDGSGDGEACLSRAAVFDDAAPALDIPEHSPDSLLPAGPSVPMPIPPSPACVLHRGSGLALGEGTPAAGVVIVPSATISAVVTASDIC
jgi:hypothetical protein